MKRFVVLIISLLSFQSIAQQNIRLENIMKGSEFIGHLPSNQYWSWDNKRIYFSWNPENNPGNSLYYWEKGFSAPKKVPDNEIPDTYVKDIKQTGILRFYIKSGALFSFNTQTKVHQKLIHTEHHIQELQLIPSQSEHLYFVQENNLFELNTKSNSFTQVTNFHYGKDPKNKADEESYLEQQQVELFEYIREKNKKTNWYKSEQEKLSEKFPKAYYYGSNSIENIQISNDEQFVLFRLSTYPKDKETHYENYVSASGNAYDSKARAKVSIHALSKHQMGIYDRKKDSVYFVSFSSLTDIRKTPVYLSLYPNFNELASKDREIVMHEAIFNKKGNYCVVDVRSLDNKDRWIVSIDLASGKVVELDHQHDSAWIGGPGISEWNFVSGTLGFLKDEETIYFQSEENGFSHLYFLNLLTQKKKQITSGLWEIRDIQLSRDKECFYITANKNHPGNREFYRLQTSNLKMEPILTETGAVEVSLSPDEKSLAFLFSDSNHPWELFYTENKSGAFKTRITHSTTAEFEAIQWMKPEVITFQAKDQTNVYARIYEPKSERKNGAAVIFVHGAGYLQNAHNYWSSYFREYMFHNLLVEKGYTVLDIDYRASDGYGRDFRTGIYRHMGGLDLSDQLDGKKLLVEKYHIDSNRVGIYGGSYGGFITLMALLTEPGQFKCGAALRSVTDWAHYNLEYTSNILNFPETDPEAYRRSSPIYFAENLQDQLVMLHGMVDDNVQFQDVVRISQRFIELGKSNWELAVFPVEAHGFKESYSWLDEYKRILNLFEENLK